MNSINILRFLGIIFLLNALTAYAAEQSPSDAEQKAQSAFDSIVDAKKSFNQLALLLVNKANVHQRDRKGNSLINCMMMRYGGEWPAVDLDPRIPLLLFKFGANPDEANAHGITPLMCYIYDGIHPDWYENEYNLFKTHARNLIRMGASSKVKQSFAMKNVSFSESDDCASVLQRSCERWRQYDEFSGRSWGLLAAIKEAQQDIKNAVAEKSKETCKELQQWIANDVARIVVDYAQEDYVMPQSLVNDLENIERDVTRILEHCNAQKNNRKTEQPKVSKKRCVIC